MEIQRVKFLLIASALAAPACVTTVTDENAGTGTGGSSGSSTGGAQNGTGGRNGGTGGKATGGNVSQDGGGPSTGGSAYEGGTDGSAGGADGSAGADGAAGSDGSTGGTSGDGGISDGSTGVDVNRPDGAVCDDITLAPGGYGDCDLLGGDGCADKAFEVSQCNDTKTSMKPFIAQQTIQCMLDNAACDVIETYHCKDKIVKLSCPDPTADDECDTIHAACSAVSVAECKLYLSGLTQSGRDGMVSCLTGNCSFGLYTCLEGL